jgi:hypothetical protein
MRLSNPAAFMAAALPSLMALPALLATPAHAHVIAGVRVFPVTLTIDDPGTADEASLPAFTYQRAGADGGTGPMHDLGFGWEYDKTITENTALILNDGYNVNLTRGSKTEAGFQNLFITGKWQAYTNAEHEFVVSLGVIREIGGSGASAAGADETGATAPTFYFGKGLGDLPIGLARPLAVTGEFGYTVADEKLKNVTLTDPTTGSIAAQFMNKGQSNAWSGGLSVQYSLPYLQSQVKDVGLGDILGNMIPLVEFTWASPASKPSNVSTSWVAAPGIIYLAQWG